MKNNSYFKLPFKKDPYPYTSFAWNQEDDMVLGFDMDISYNMYTNIIDTLNGEQDVRIPNLSIRDGVDFFTGDTFLFCIRGWGSLTSSGLSTEQAAKIQDEFAQEILEKLKLN